jgi:hypothetical protein
VLTLIPRVAAFACGCGGANASKTERVCRSLHENPVLFDRVLIRGEPAIDFPERTLTPASVVTDWLGQPGERLPLRNVLVTWWRHDNSAFLIADLAANRAGHQFLAARACDWAATKRKLEAPRRHLVPGQ